MVLFTFPQNVIGFRIIRHADYWVSAQITNLGVKCAIFFL